MPRRRSVRRAGALGGMRFFNCVTTVRRAVRRGGSLSKNMRPKPLTMKKTTRTRCSSCLSSATTMSSDRTWWVYVLVSGARRRTYVGISVDVDRRLQEHNGVRCGGAKATRAGRPWRIHRRFGPYATRGEAQRIEAFIKKLPHTAKMGLSHIM